MGSGRNSETSFFDTTMALLHVHPVEQDFSERKNDCRNIGAGENVEIFLAVLVNDNTPLACAVF
jgi:hypothetical protein